MPYGAKAIANHFLELAKADGQPLDPMKIQKLVYFAHGWCLALKDVPLIAERVEAWRYGPVIRTLYDSFKSVGNGPITEPAYEARAVGGRLTFFAPRIDDQEASDLPENAFVHALLKEVWRVYGKLSAIQLSNLTHLPGTPWDKTWGDGAEGMSKPIDDEVIKEFFKNQKAKSKKAT